MGKVSVNVPQAGGLAAPLRAAAVQIGLRSTRLKLGRVTPNGGSATAGMASADK